MSKSKITITGIGSQGPGRKPAMSLGDLRSFLTDCDQAGLPDSVLLTGEVSLAGRLRQVQASSGDELRELPRRPLDTLS